MRIFLILRSFPHLWGHLKKKLQHRYSLNTSTGPHWNRLFRCHGAFESFRPVTLIPKNVCLTQFVIISAPPRLPITALTATLESTPSLFCVEVVLSSILPLWSLRAHSVKTSFSQHLFFVSQSSLYLNFRFHQTQLHTRDIKHLLQYNMGFQSLTHSYFSVLLWPSILTEISSTWVKSLPLSTP